MFHFVKVKQYKLQKILVKSNRLLNIIGKITKQFMPCVQYRVIQPLVVPISDILKRLSTREKTPTAGLTGTLLKTRAS